MPSEPASVGLLRQLNLSDLAARDPLSRSQIRRAFQSQIDRVQRLGSRDVSASSQERSTLLHDRDAKYWQESGARRNRVAEDHSRGVQHHPPERNRQRRARRDSLPVHLQAASVPRTPTSWAENGSES